MKTTPHAIIYFLIAPVLGAVGQFFYKAGADRVEGSLESDLLNNQIMLGVCCYFAVMLWFVATFKLNASRRLPLKIGTRLLIPFAPRWMEALQPSRINTMASGTWRQSL